MRADHGGVTAFQFRLERVRALRERGEDLAKEALAGALSRRSSSEQQLQAVGEQLARARERQREAAAAPMTAFDLVARQRYLERVEQDRRARELDLSRMDAEVDARRSALRHAARERQALERLEARQRADHARAVARAETAQLDEIALMLHVRRAA